MQKSKLLIFLAVVTGVLFAVVNSASAEFQGKGSSGKTTMAIVNFEGGGAKVNCGEPETKGDPEWEVEKEGKASEKGPALHLKFKPWSVCSSEFAGVTRAVTSSECEMEVDQSKEEEKVPVTDVSACAFKAESCEVTIEPKENAERKWASVALSGKEDENLNLQFEVTGITTTVKGASCGLLGIKATHEGKLSGAIDAQDVAPAAQPASEFRLAFPPNVVPYIRRRGSGGRIEVLLANAQSVAVAGPGIVRFTTAEPGVTPAAFAVANETVATCAGFAFGANASCGMKVEYTRNTYPTNVYINFAVTRPGGGVESRLSVGALNQ